MGACVGSLYAVCGTEHTGMNSCRYEVFHRSFCTHFHRSLMRQLVSRPGLTRSHFLIYELQVFKDGHLHVTALEVCVHLTVKRAALT